MTSAVKNCVVLLFVWSALVTILQCFHKVIPFVRRTYSIYCIVYKSTASADDHPTIQFDVPRHTLRTM